MELLAPNGQQSNLTAEQYELVRTPAFKAWFGDWENNPENSSKVVDKNGEPLPQSHFTDSRFTKFKTKESGFHFGDPSIKGDLEIAKSQTLDIELKGLFSQSPNHALKAGVRTNSYCSAVRLLCCPFGANSSMINCLISFYDFVVDQQ